MINIRVENETTTIQTEGTVMETLIELQVATVEVMNEICEGGPDGIRNILVPMYLKTLKQAFEFEE